MKHIVIDTKLHSDLKFYCLIHNLKLTDFVSKKLKNLPEIKELSKQRKRLKFR